MSKRNLKKLRKENESLKEMCARKMAPSTDPILDAILQMESYLKRHYDFRFNRMNEITEYRTHGTLPFAPLSQRDLNSICIAVRKAGINVGIRTSTVLFTPHKPAVITLSCSICRNFRYGTAQTD